MIPSQLQPLANHLWQSTLFAGIAALLTLVLRKNAARTRYWLWLAASVKFLVPFSILVMAGSSIGRPTPAPIAPPITFVIEQVSQPFAVSAHAAIVPAAQPSSASAIPAVFCIIWAIGFVFVVSSWWRRSRTIRAALGGASPLDLPLGIKVMSSPVILEPGVFGVRRPVLLLPEGIISHLTRPQLKAILAHELCHVRRRDNLASVFHMSVEALFWFHPLVWWLGARLMEERENACDEEVLRSGSEPEVYAEGILKICELYLASPLPCVSGVTGSNLKKRIETIMSNRTVFSLNVGKKLALAIAGTAAVAVPIAFGIFGILDASPLAQSPQSAPSSTPKWEAVSIRPCKNGEAGFPQGGATPGRLRTPCVTLVSLIRSAYIAHVDGQPGPVFVSSAKISGGPSWINSDRYEINAKAEGNPGNGMMNGPMLQALLEDRFKLKVHRETREVSMYALTVAKGGPKLQSFKEGSCAPRTLPVAPLPPGQTFCGPSFLVRRGPTLTQELHGISLEEFSKMLDGMLDRPVIDKTGISGRFDFHLEFVPDEAIMPTSSRIGLDPDADSVAAPANFAEGPSIFTAFREQLGLKLEPTKGPGKFLVIDSVERPSGN
jgi:bla regulator protein BlaR1